ncbi:putative epoxide hydrolase [Actinoplanes missouriensis 431]|uniref:Putative epoxide hydrolase n=1 Tax=Actinoplanes missouriensis (strain ATCC 14538 / DSM 43046 / CBS 188.64 / JCM 3121 / NBRC 102363 / NCIMB 12654 / NRRL B-3342 / UNCC 431) TaxID=512565 RepID=I0HA15_ACTM4|nr:epoxide hydrolase family protein [Actinoplanes missouriensis]BAL89852.1 putative epoxide hydrolase [Actinoplanes missouriensis 431]
MTSSASHPTRRQLLAGGVAAGLTAAASTVLGSAPAGAASPQAPARIRPFRAAIPRERVAEMRRRIAATRWPSRELVADRSQGVQLATAQALARFWTTGYDWRRCEDRLNALPQFTTEIDGVDIHFVHVRSPHRDALPLVMTHGWPGSIVELLETVGPLTNPTAHGGTAADAFHLVLPSLPGFGFSGKPTELGWDTARTARAWAELMRRLGYGRYVAQGGDVGAAVTDDIGRLAPAGLLAIHLNLLVPALAGTGGLPVNTDEERAAADALRTFSSSGKGYLVEQSTRPQTIGYALLDSPVALAAWMLDHDTDSYLKISRAFRDGRATGNLTREHVLDNISLYWLTGTGESAARAYWERTRTAGPATAPVTVPVAFSAFPGEIFQAPRSWAEASYPTLSYYHRPARGGHFAAWEQPLIFTRELRAAFRSVR